MIFTADELTPLLYQAIDTLKEPYKSLIDFLLIPSHYKKKMKSDFRSTRIHFLSTHNLPPITKDHDPFEELKDEALRQLRVALAKRQIHNYSDIPHQE